MYFATPNQHSDDLTQLTEQVVLLNKERRRLGSKRFSFALEQEYLSARNRHFWDVDRPLLIVGALFYVLFAWSDIVLGGENASFILSLRLFIGTTLLSVLLLAPRSYLKQRMMSVAAVGVLVVGVSILFFITQIPSELRFAYHLGLIPIQVFALVVLRQSVRAVAFVSCSLFLGYVALLISMPPMTDRSEINQLIVIFLPMFLCFWFLLLLLSLYLSYSMEKIWRNDFLQNKLLDIEAKRLALLSQELQALSTTDALTGVANRRYFDNQFKTEWRRALRYQNTLALIMIDVDYFKDYNDHYGHQAGDECLKRIADVLTRYSQRPGEFCARVGGEEFVIVLARSQAEDALQVAKMARQAVFDLALPHVRSAFGRCTVSMGVALTVPSSEEGASELLQGADRCLYQAKHQGRNQEVMMVF